MKDFPIEVKKPFIIWIICLLLFILLIILDSLLKDTAFEALLNNSIVPLLVLGIILGGVISFLFFSISTISYFFKKGSLKKRNIVIKILKTFLIILILPILLFIEVLKPLRLIKLIIKKKVGDIFSKQSFKKYAFSFLIVIFLFPLWALPYFFVSYVVANALGFVSSPIPIAGTGSMYPTFPKGSKKDLIEQSKETIGSYDFMPYPNGLVLFGKRYFGYKLQRGDIVLAINEKIKENGKKLYGEPSGVIKRIIALPGDTLEIRDGLVYLNGNPLVEPYTAKPHSTFGEGFLGECKKITIPKNKLFIMGDNRKGSGDSREFGLVDFNDIESAIPFQKQKGKLDKYYRDTSKDLNDSTRIKLDKTQYLELLNNKRAEAGVQLLKYQPLLEKAATKQGEMILKYNDFSYEATRSGYTMEKAMREVGYSNIVWNEAFIQGYYDTKEFIDYYFDFPEWEKFLLEKDFQEIGISEVEGEINKCPTQVIVQHFAGYVPPNYTKETIESWGRIINNIEEILPSWEKMKNWQNVNRNDLDKLLGLLYRRKNNAEAIYYRMKANQWLTSNEEGMMTEDKNLYEQINVLANRLNGK
ncbi:MAG: signal peptidase I [Patescibacteria group bacterium]